MVEQSHFWNGNMRRIEKLLSRERGENDFKDHLIALENV
jgi:hypothetical protein